MRGGIFQPEPTGSTEYARGGFARHKSPFVTRSVLVIAVLMLRVSISSAQLPTTLDDFFHPGTQPDLSGGKNFAPIITANNCANCHEIYDPIEVPISTRWKASMKANALRDPLFQAALTIANQDADFGGDLCLRCHTPGGWLAGRSTPTDGSDLTNLDFEGVSCHLCHRMVDPVFQQDVSPPQDESILALLEAAGLAPLAPGNAGFVIDPADVRRGPRDDVPANYHGMDVPIIPSPFHSSSALCGTCHDVSNPVFRRQPDGTYLLDPLALPHETLDKHDMFPLERTYSEWLHSDFANGGVDMGGVFGGNHPTGVMVTCQDCHMPKTEAYTSAFNIEPFFLRPDVPAHDFNGGSTWMLDAIYNLYGEDAFFPWYMEDSQARARYMLQNAATLKAFNEGCSIRVRITNQTGHKLPTGYPEGRRMWLTIEFRDDILQTVVYRGAYDALSATLTTEDTKVYEAQLGIDRTVASATGLPRGPSFHFVLNNKYFKDNRIPPRGFTNAAFEAVLAAPVAADYADGQYWDDTDFRIPPGATSAVVRLYYQTASKEYIEFLRDENITDFTGEVLYNQWALLGKSPPELMKEIVIMNLVAGESGDADCDGDRDLIDHAQMYRCLTGPGETISLGCEAWETDLDGDADLRDLAIVQRNFTGSQ